MVLLRCPQVAGRARRKGKQLPPDVTHARGRVPVARVASEHSEPRPPRLIVAEGSWRICDDELVHVARQIDLQYWLSAIGLLSGLISPDSGQYTTAVDDMIDMI